MTAKACAMVGLLLIVGTAVVRAAPNIPPSELPGRERERFTPSPIDRFTDPLASRRNAERRCDEQPRRLKKKSKRDQGC